MELRLNRGGFLRPFGYGWFIKEFLLRHGPEGSPRISPDEGVPQKDIFYHYKLALHKAYADDAIAYENEERIKKGLPIYTEIEHRERLEWYMRSIPYKLVKCRHHSFQRYFHWLKQLGWVEFTGKEEKYTVQENMPSYPEAPPRRYYRLTRKGIVAPDYEWSRPQLVVYPELGLEYFSEKSATTPSKPPRSVPRRYKAFHRIRRMPHGAAPAVMVLFPVTSIANTSNSYSVPSIRSSGGICTR